MRAFFAACSLAPSSQCHDLLERRLQARERGSIVKVSQSEALHVLSLPQKHVRIFAISQITRTPAERRWSPISPLRLFDQKDPRPSWYLPLPNDHLLAP